MYQNFIKVEADADVSACGTQSREESANDLMNFVLQIASGKKTKAEQKGFREISIFKDGIVL